MATSQPQGLDQTVVPAGLRWCSDDAAGIRRRRAGRGFCYIRPDGSRLGPGPDLDRIRALAIPPAWRDVWICPLAKGHIQATGRDARDRKQYIYHPEWISAQSRNKFARLPAFAAALPRLEMALETALARRDMGPDKVVATAVRLMQLSLIRVGNTRYSRQNRSYGLTTLRKKHIEISGHDLRLHFRGKSGVEHDVSVQNRRLTSVVRRLSELPGQTLFQYRDSDGVLRPVTSDEINSFIRQHMGDDFSAKDFRTWAATVSAARILCDTEAPTSPTDARRKVNACLKSVAASLGNTLAVCRSAYVHPAVIELYEAGALATTLPDPEAKRFEKALAAALASTS